MNTTTRAIRIPDEAWNRLEQCANEHKLRGRAEYIVYALDHPDTVERVVEVPDPETLHALEAANAEIARLQTELQAARLRPVQTPPIMAYEISGTSSAIMEKELQTTLRPLWQTILDSWTDKERKEWMDNKWKGFAENWCKKTLNTAYALMDKTQA